MFSFKAENVDKLIEIQLHKDKEIFHQVICFNTWVTQFVLLLMRQYIFYGFELNLYSEYELYYIYWYVSEIIIICQIKNFERLVSFLLAHEKWCKSK